MPELPSGTVTFLFTDIEGSTALWERDRAAMAVAVERHLRLLRTAIEAHGGVLFKVVGDAVQAAFAIAPAAVAAALDAQRGLLAEAWGTPDPLRVRMALHAGEAEPRDGDYLTAPLNRLSRLLVTGYGAQILLTQAVQQLCRDALPAGVTLRDLGEHRLRDLLQPERIFQLVHPDLPTEFPPLKSLDVQPHNLPLQPTPFLGREREVAEIVGLLRRPEIRLLTLTGAGGTGKSRLALQVAAELLDDFADGVFFVALAPLTDPALLPVAIAGALGVPEAGEHTLVERLRQVLANLQVLVVLDNVEHLVEAVPTVGELLGSVPGLKIVATSRVPLRLRAEHEYPVSPLGLPPRQPPPRPEQLAQYEAARLFIARAQAVDPAFAVDSENAQAIAEICHRLDGLPLAIELAATRIRMLPPRALLARLERRLPLLTTGARDAPARQRTLRDAIAWSYDLLSAQEQTLFRRLAVFVGGCTLEAAEAVSGNAGGDAVEGVASLIDKSLLRQTETGDVPRFRMLETVREYGLERLTAAGEEEETRRRHADWCLALAEAAEPAFLRMLPGQAAWVVRLESEHANLRAALGWLLASGDARLGLRLAAALWWFWHMRGHLGEGRDWLERGLATAVDAPAETRARAIFGACLLTHYLGDDARALALGEQSLALFRQIGDRPGIGRALNLLGVVTEDMGDFDRAAALFDEALALHRVDDDRPWTAHALRHLALVTYGQGDLDRAAALSEEALALHRALEVTWGVTVTLIYLGVVASERGDYARAATAYAEALTLARQQGSRQGIARGLVGVATLAALSDQSAAAARLFGASDAICTALGYHFGLPERAQYERARAATRSALGDEAFVIAWEAGRVLPDDEAIAEALAVVALVAATPTLAS